MLFRSGELSSYLSTEFHVFMDDFVGPAPEYSILFIGRKKLR